MPENAHVKELHIFDNIDQLDKNLDSSDLKDKRPGMLFKSAGLLFKKAESEREAGDEEKAYILYMRYLRVISFLQKSPDYTKNKKYYKDMIGVNNPSKALDYAEKLKKSLILRFAAAEEKKKLKDIEEQEKVKQKILNDRQKAKQNLPSSVKADCIGIPALDGDKISCLQLFSLFNKSEKQNILLVDIRTSTDFMDSHIIHSHCINVPEEIITEGLSAKVLEEKFPLESRKLWCVRTSKDLIVMIDWSSHQIAPGSTLRIFKTIITKWDREVKYEREPVFLMGGYEEWLLRYPSHTTNAKVTHPDKNAVMDNFLHGIEYPDFSDLMPVKPKPKIDIPPPKDTNFQDTKVNPNPKIDRSSKAAAIQVYSDRAKQMHQILEEQVKLADTSLNVEKERVEAERDWELTQRKREMEAEEEERANLQVKGQEIIYTILQLENKQRDVDLEKQDLTEKYELYREESVKLAERMAKEQKERDIDEEKTCIPVTSDEGTSISAHDLPLDDSYEEVSKKMAAEELEKKLRIRATEEERAALDRQRLELEEIREKKLAEAREKAKPVFKRQLEDSDTHTETLNEAGSSSGLDRSFSSPDITQVDQDDPMQNHKMPLFDRTAKPIFRSIAAESNITRQRDFQGVWGSPGKGLTGLKNLGNTCYMNSIIQCLNNTTILSSYFIDDAYRKHVNRNLTTKGAIAEEVAAVMKTLWSGQYKSIATRDLRNVVGKHQNMFRGAEQQDSHEFLTILMDWLHDDLQIPTSQPINKDSLQPSDKAWYEYTKSKESLILRLFYGQIKSTVQCKMCSKESVTYESFSNLSLELPGNTNKCTLSDCLKLYLNGETIVGWNCPSCKEKREAWKKLDISRLPPVLVIHFKRFYVDAKEYTSNMYRKKQTYIDFPLQDLDMRSFSLDLQNGNSRIYNLYGVSNHYGSMEGGHYTAYCKSSLYSKWYKYDDHIVTEISPHDVKSSAAYILFYMTGT